MANWALAGLPEDRANGVVVLEVREQYGQLFTWLYLLNIASFKRHNKTSMNKDSIKPNMGSISNILEKYAGAWHTYQEA